jgi:5-amino-6-(5-phospho-D-ribitylamino)uracil phosphatase
MTTILSPAIEPPTAGIPSQAKPKRAKVDLVALDLDGTLLRSDKRLSVKVVEAVKMVRRAGVRVVLATARPPRSVREIYNVLKLDTYQINYNGALIHDPMQRTHLFHQPLPSDTAWRVVKLARKIDPKVVISVEILDKWYTDHVDESLPTETSRSFMPDFVGPLEAFMHVPVTKLMLLAPPERLKAVRKQLTAKFSDRLALAISDPHLLQIVHPGVDKSIALAQLAGHYGVARENVMAIGDAPNDLGMIQWAGLGVAMGNAYSALRDAADLVVPTNDDDGVAHALHEHALG